jgi:hypothetical protein
MTVDSAQVTIERATARSAGSVADNWSEWGLAPALLQSAGSLPVRVLSSLTNGLPSMT